MQVINLTYAFLVVAGIAFVASYVSVGGFMANAVRISNRIRVRYLKSVLRQDITFFDAQATTGGLLSTLNGDTSTVQDGLGEKVVTFLQVSSGTAAL